MKWTRLWTILFLCSMISVPTATAKDWQKRLEMERISAALYRGREPDNKDFKRLAESGIKTVINLRLSTRAVRKDSELARKQGMNHVHIPVGFFKRPYKEIDKFLTIAQDPEYQPVYVHCQGGQDRAGLFVLAYRLKVQGWDFQSAYDELVEKDFRRWLVTLWKTAKEMRAETPATSAVAARSLQSR